MRPSVLSLVVIALAMVLAVAPSAEANDSYSKATKVGNAHMPDCGKNGFNDVKGQCWTCPDGYHHQVYLPADDKHSCKKSGHWEHRKGHDAGKANLAGGCDKGMVSVHDGRCYTCPHDWHHNPARAGDDPKFCSNKTDDRYHKASKQSGNVLCDKGFFDPADGGSCWTCPKDYPHRTLTHAVTSDKACHSDACGGKNERPCPITKAGPVCDKGLIPNYFIGECVHVDVKESVCKETVKAIRNGQKIAGLAEVLEKLTKSTDDKRNDLNADAILKQIGDYIEKHVDKKGELKRIWVAMDEQEKEVAKLFHEDVFCAGSHKEREKKLAELGLKPDFGKKKSHSGGGSSSKESKSSSDGHFYMAYSASFALDAALGVQASLSIVTDYDGHGGGFVSVGPEFVTNLTGGLGLGVDFYPDTKTADFEGWGWGVGASGGTPFKILGVGVGASFNQGFNELQGFGVNGSIGAGLLPADLGVSDTHTWKVW